MEATSVVASVSEDQGSSRRRGIWFRSATLFLAVTVLTLGLFVVFIIPYQKSILIDRMESTAEVISTSIDQVTVTSIVVEDYSSAIEHCLKVVTEGPEVLYLVVTRRDGFSLVHQSSMWRYNNLEGYWRPADSELRKGSFLESELAGQKVFHYSYPLRYSGIDWGWIHIGLSLQRFNADLHTIYLRTALLAGLCIGVSALLSLAFTRRLSQPLLLLDQTTRRVAEGDLTARADIHTGDEVESLSHSFNMMTEALRKAHDELEQRVQERTAELSQSNALLRQEVAERARAVEAQKAAEQELEAQRALSMRSDRLRSLGEMAAGIAHELNQPLVGVRGLAEHILISMDRNWDLSEDKLRTRLQCIVEQADRMVHIIDHVRLFAREAGKPDVSPVNVNEVIGSGVDMLGAQFQSHGVTLECELADDLPLVMGNPYSLEEVVLNLLSNARDAVQSRFGEGTDPTAGRVRLKTGLNSEEAGLRVTIEVEDNGAGIAEDALARIFDPFYTTKAPDKGTGLGLAISKSIVDDIGGQISARSEEDSGTVVTIFLPALDRPVRE